jgi:hypothetical protein
MLGGNTRTITLNELDELHYSEPFNIETGATRYSAQARVTTEEATYSFDVTLQGGWSNADPDVTADWIDLDFAAVLANTDSGLVRFEDSNTPALGWAYAEFPQYRWKLDPGAADLEATIEIRLTELG